MDSIREELTRATAVQAFKREPPDLDARIIDAIISVGPRNVAQIARMTSAHQETVRYKIVKRFGRRGFRFQAEVDYAKLGLSLHWATFEISPPYYALAPKLFGLMNEVGYIVHYSKSLPGGHYNALFALPTGTRGEFSEFLDGLKCEQIFRSFELDEVVTERHKPMDISQFDFQRDCWDVDWQKVRNTKAVPLPVEKSRVKPLADGTDMKIIKELQINALQHTTEIARKVGVNEKTVEYHYRKHIIDWKLIPGFRVRWMKDLTNTLTHSMIVVTLTFRGLHGEFLKKVQSSIYKLPFLWVEYFLRSGIYLATLAVPLPDFIETMAYVNEELRFLGQSVDVGYMKLGDSFNYTIPYDMYVNGDWEFDTTLMKATILEKISGGLKK